MTRNMALKAAARNKARKARAARNKGGPVLEIRRNTSISDPNNGYAPTAQDNLGSIEFTSNHERQTVSYADLSDE
jgi:hypothetical protein